MAQYRDPLDKSTLEVISCTMDPTEEDPDVNSTISRHSQQSVPHIEATVHYLGSKWCPNDPSWTPPPLLLEFEMFIPTILDQRICQARPQSCLMLKNSSYSDRTCSTVTFELSRVWYINLLIDGWQKDSLLIVQWEVIKPAHPPLGSYLASPVV